MCSETGCPGAAFADIVFALDNDGGFLGNGPNGNPWFDSNEMTAAEITGAFSQAAAGVLGNGGTALGCEHVLSSATDLLVGDATGFLRPDALLVLVLVTDVDDFGEYDQVGWPQCTCPLGICDQLCTTAGRSVDELYADLLARKGGDPAAIGGIMLAGDPGITEGMNMCGQPATCCGGGLECGQAHQRRGCGISPRRSAAAGSPRTSATAPRWCRSRSRQRSAVRSILHARRFVPPVEPALRAG